MSNINARKSIPESAKRGQKHIPASEWREVKRKLNMLGRPAFDAANMGGYRATGNSIMRWERAADDAELDQMYKVTRQDEQYVNIRPGLWQRAGGLAGTGYDADHAFDPAALAGVSDPTSSDIICYAVLMSSAGLDVGSWTDLAYDSSDFDQSSNTANGVMIVFADAILNAVDPGAQWLYLATIRYDSSAEISEIVDDHGHTGPKQDNDPLNHGAEGAADGFFYEIAYTSETVYEFTVYGGSWKATPTVGFTAFPASTTFTKANFDANSGKDIYATILPDDADVSSITEDPCLVPAQGRVEMDGLSGWTPDSWEDATYKNNGLVKLVVVDAPYTFGTETAYPVAQLYPIHHARVANDYFRPDGGDFGQSVLDDAYPRFKTTDFVTTENEHEGELQLSQAMELLGVAVDIANVANDQILPVIDYQHTSGTSDMGYFRVDSHNAATWGDGTGRSLEMYTSLKIAQLYGWAQLTSTIAVTDATSDLDGSASKYHVLLRKNDAVPTLYYGTLDTMKVADSYLADSASTISGNHPHENHTFNSDDHTTSGVDRYIIAGGDEMRNNMEGYIGDSSGDKSIGPSQRVLYSDDGTTSAVDWSATNSWLTDSSNVTSILWGDRQGYDSGGNLIFDYAAINDGKLYGDWNMVAGSFYVPNGEYYYHNSKQGATVTDDGNALYSGGLITNEDGWSVLEVQVTQGGVTKDVKIFGKFV